MDKHVWPTYLHHKSVSKCYVSPLGKGKTVTGMSSREMQQQENHRQGSRMNTDQFLKWALKAQASREVWSRANRMLDFNSPKSFPGFMSHSERILARFHLGKLYLLIKNLTEFHKMVGTGVDPHLLFGDKIAMSVHLRYIVFVNCLP